MIAVHEQAPPLDDPYTRRLRQASDDAIAATFQAEAVRMGCNRPESLKFEKGDLAAEITIRSHPRGGGHCWCVRWRNREAGAHAFGPMLHLETLAVDRLSAVLGAAAEMERQLAASICVPPLLVERVRRWLDEVREDAHRRDPHPPEPVMPWRTPKPAMTPVP